MTQKLYKVGGNSHSKKHIILSGKEELDRFAFSLVIISFYLENVL